MSKKKVTQKRLKEVLYYNPETGIFTWLTSLSARGKAGSKAGCVSKPKKIIIIGIDCEEYKAHRLAWLYVYGYFPEQLIDHIDRNPSNNKINNLRESSKSCNAINCKLRSDNVSGVKGVSWGSQNKGWGAEMRINGKKINWGYYKDFDEAVCYRLAMEQCLGYEECDFLSPAKRYVKKNILKKGV